MELGCGVWAFAFASVIACSCVCQFDFEGIFVPGFTADGSVENFKRRRQTELKHGRIAMLATMGYITPEQLVVDHGLLYSFVLWLRHGSFHAHGPRMRALGWTVLS